MADSPGGFVRITGHHKAERGPLAVLRGAGLKDALNALRGQYALQLPRFSKVSMSRRLVSEIV